MVKGDFFSMKTEQSRAYLGFSSPTERPHARDIEEH